MNKIFLIYLLFYVIKNTLILSKLDLKFECTPEMRDVTGCKPYFERELTVEYYFYYISDITMVVSHLVKDLKEPPVFYLPPSLLFDKHVDAYTLMKTVLS